MFRGIKVFAVAALACVAITGGSLSAKKDLVGTTVAAGSFESLVIAVKAAGLVDTLKGTGPFTVFAPTDEAFAKLPAGTFESLLKLENRDRLVAILTYHVVPGRVMSGDIAGKNTSIKTVQGQSVSVATANGVMVDAANVISADIVSSNGVINVIDNLILPKS